MNNHTSGSQGKRALVLSGGGSKGAYSVGVVKALLESGRKYDVIAGVSVGSLIASHVAMYKPEDQWSGYDALERIWKEKVKNNESVYKPWAPGFLTYLWSLWKGGIYSMRPLRDIIEGEFEPGNLDNSGVTLYVGVVSLQSGEYRGVNIEPTMKQQKAVDWIWASSIFPILFPPVEIDGEQWLDGGVRDVVPVKDILANHPEVTHIDAVITSPRKGGAGQQDGKFLSVVDVAIRGAGLLADEVYVSDLTGHCSEHGTGLTVYDPSEQPNDDSFRFDPEEIQLLIQKGYEETKVKIALELSRQAFESEIVNT